MLMGSWLVPVKIGEGITTRSAVNLAAGSLSGSFQLLGFRVSGIWGF